MGIEILLNKTTPILSSFLNNTLPKVCSNWWEECVSSKLSESQKRQIEVRKLDSLELLDLAALLRVLNYNWKEISYIRNLPIEVRNYANELITIRNKFAHLGNSYPNDDYIFRAADTIQLFVSAIEENNLLVEEIKEFKKSLHIHSMISPVKDSKIDIPNKEKDISSLKEEPIGKLVKRYIPTILKYGLNSNESELNQLKDRKHSKELFGIQFPFLIEVSSNSVKIERYGKPIYSFNNRYFVVTSEWYERNRKKFINYLNDKKILELIDNQIIIPKSENLIIKEEKNFRDINFEIDKIHNRIPKWFKSPNQINHKILVKYLELRGQNEFVYFTELDHQLQSIKTLRANCNQMNNFGDKNHAKVFDEINGKIYLWEPVKEFILKEYKSIQ